MERERGKENEKVGEEWEMQRKKRGLMLRADEKKRGRGVM